MAGAAAVAQQGITSESFPVGTIFSVKMNPLRDGSNFGSRVGAIAVCPWNKGLYRNSTPGENPDLDQVQIRVDSWKTEGSPNIE